VISKLRISESKYIVLRKWFEDEKQVTATAKKAKNKAAAAAAEQSNSPSTAATPSSSSSTVLASTRNNSNARVQTRCEYPFSMQTRNWRRPSLFMQEHFNIRTSQVAPFFGGTARCCI